MDIFWMVFPYVVCIGSVAGGVAVLVWANNDAVKSKDDI